MWRRIESFHHTFGILTLLVIVMCGSSCRDSRTHESYSYRLSRGAYSPDANSLLFVIHVDVDLDRQIPSDLAELMKVKTLFAIYDEEKRLAKHLLYPIDADPFDFAWAPGQAVFVVTHGDRMTLFQKDTDSEYSGTAIKCPVNLAYTFCSWNPKGEWLAVNCSGLKKNKLGIYNLKEEKFVLSDILIDYRPPVWKNDAIVYVANDDNLLEVRMESGAPRLVRTIPIGKGATLFYGMLNDQALVLKDNKIKLGDRTLVEFDMARKDPVITTKRAIFVSASPTNLVVFDHKGREIDRTNPGRTIDFGPVGKDPNTVYGLAGSMLLLVSVEKGSLNIEKVVDLSDESIYVMPSISENAKSASKQEH